MGIENTVEHESDDNSNCNWCSWFGIRTGGVGNNRTGGDCPNYRFLRSASGKPSANVDMKNSQGIKKIK